MEQSATYDQMEAAFYAMKNQAKEEDGILYYQGALTKTLEDNGITRSKYSHITGYLKGMGCIERIRRGAGAVPSVWIIHKKPDRQAFEDYKITKNPTRRYGRYARTATEQERDAVLTDIHNRLQEIEKRLDIAG